MDEKIDKQELIKRLGWIRYADNIEDIRYKFYNKAVDTALSIAERLEEIEKPIVPQFVADWYKEHKKDFEVSIYTLCVKWYEDNLPKNLNEWFSLPSNEPVQTLVKMHLYGYEVKKEKRCITKLLKPNPDEQNLYENQSEEGFDLAKCSALGAKNLDKQEKPVLSKYEAEWINKLTKSNNLSDSLYYITRCGFRYPFVFVDNGKIYKLSINTKDIKNYEDLCKIKERLINAVIFGYEVKEEKLYTVEIPNPNGERLILCKNKSGKVFFQSFAAEKWEDLCLRTSLDTKLTEKEIKKDYAGAWQFAKEVEDN